MLKKIKNLFSKSGDTDEDKSPSTQDEDVIGAITYYFKSSDDNTYMDIQLDNYENDTIDKFAKIISGLSSIRFQLETLQMIKDCFVEIENEEIFNEIVVKMIQHTEDESDVIEKINKGNRDKEEEPWIKPSDMIK